MPNFSAKKKQYNISPDEDISLQELFLLGELMEVVQNGGKSFKTYFISLNVQSLIWRTDAVYYRYKIKGINGFAVKCEQIIVHCTFVFNQIEAIANNITGTG